MNMKMKFIAITSVVCGISAIYSQPAFAQGSTGKWVWSDTGWGRATSVSPPATGGYATASVTVANPLSPTTGTVDTTANAWPALLTNSRTATAAFATTRTFYWQSGCGSPAPTPFTQKTGTIAANYSGSTSASSSPSGTGNASGIIYVGVFLSYSDDYNGNGDPFHGQVGTLAASARYASDNKLAPPAPTPSGSSSASPSVISKLKTQVSFYAHYEITSATTADHTFGPFALQTGSAEGELTGSVPY